MCDLSNYECVEEVDEPLYEKCFIQATIMMKTKDYGIDIFQLADLMYKVEKEKEEKETISDRNIEYNTNIVSIEDMGLLECIDISVTGDNLFYCNGILTKNSWGLPQTADFMVAMITSEELEGLKQIMFKVLKNRYADPSFHKRFVVGVDKTKMRLYDIDQNLNSDSDKPVFDNSSSGMKISEEGKGKKKSFSGFSH